MHISVIDSSSGSNLEEKLKSGIWIVLFYADWCGHCQQFKPEWERMKSLMPSNLNSAEIESNNISKMSNPPQVQGFPTIKMYRDNLNVGDYEGNRTAEAILKNLKSIKITPKNPKVHTIEKHISKMPVIQKPKSSPKPLRKLSQLLEAEGHKLKKLTKEASIFNYSDNENTSSKVIMEHLKKGLEQQEKLRNENMNNNNMNNNNTKKTKKQKKQQKQQKTMVW